MLSEQIIRQSVANRIYNFSAGPAVLPVAVLEQIQQELLNYRGTGMSVMEMSHRSEAFEGIIHQTEADLRTLVGIPANYKVLFLQGGASLQFSMIPMNLLPSGASADYLITGHWSQMAIKEAQKLGHARVAATTQEGNFQRIPTQDELQLDPQAAYLHFTSNNTVYGTEWHTEPQGLENVPLICDASSDILSHPLDITKYGLLYGGTQKNSGIAGVTAVIIREDLLERVPNKLPSMLDYKLMADKESLYNTPPTFNIYVMGLVVRWLLDNGGLEGAAQRNGAKSQLLYRTIDASSGFYIGHAQPDSRSQMNVTFRLPSEDLDKKFVKEATAAGLDGLKGYRSVGGVRASLYNAFPLEGIQALVELMENFHKRNG